jgi:transposase
VPDTSQEATAALSVAAAAWQQEGALYWAPAPQAAAGERWVVVRTTAGEERVRATLARQIETMRAQWDKALWHLGNQRFACEPDAQAALARQLKSTPEWLTIQATLVPHPKQNRLGRPRQGTPADRTEWQIQATVTVADEAVTRAVQRKASFLVATNVLDADQLSDQELIRTYKDQHSVERGFAFLKDPLFLASSVFVKETGAHRGAEPGDGAVPLGLPPGRAPAARAAHGYWPDRSKPTQAPHGSADHALDLPVL